MGERPGMMAGVPRDRDAVNGAPTIGVLTPSLVELYQVQWLGVADAAAANGVDVVSFVGRELDSPVGSDREANAIYDLVSADQLDGLVVWSTALGVHAGEGAVGRFLKRFGPVPLVSVELGVPGIPSLLMDERRGMREAVAHLLTAHGYAEIAFIRGPENHRGAGQRYLGYLDALADRGIACDPSIIGPPPESWESDLPIRWLAGLLETGRRPDAIAVTNDSLAAGVLAMLGAGGLRTPEDVAVIGFDDVIGLFTVLDPDLGGPDFGREDRGAGTDALARAVSLNANTVPLTTVRAPFYELGYRAVESVLAQLRGEEAAAEEFVRTSLVIRRSCGCLSESQRFQGERGSPAGRSSATELAADLAQAVGQPIPALPSSWSQELATGFVESREDRFVTLFDEVVRAGLTAGVAVERWRAVVAVLRTAGAGRGPRATDTVPLLADAERVIDDMARRVSAYRRMIDQKQSQLVRAASQRISTSVDLDELAGVVAEELGNLEIPGCCIVAYGGGPRVLLAYDRGRLRTPAEDLVVGPGRLPPFDCFTQRPFVAVALPLYFGREQLGYVLFQAGPRVGWLYEALQGAIASALEVAFLVERERRAVDRADHARDQLEDRVRERTAELADANDALAAQLVEREQADRVRAELEERLRQAEKMEAVGRLAGGIAHDFNNLLVVINGYSDMLLDQLGTGPGTGEDVQEILKAGQRAQALTQQLLAFSRQQVLKPAVLAVNEVVLNVESMLRRLIGEDVSLETRLLPSVPTIYADRGQLEQIVVNLALNGRDAMPTGGRLLIETFAAEVSEREAVPELAAGSYAVLSVTDSGSGMDAATQRRIFEPFFTTKAQGKGTGLGLPTVFGIAKQSGGHVLVDSAPQRGSTFSVYLPARSGAPTAMPTVRRPGLVFGSETILLVEDDDRVRRATHRFLSETGYRVVDAADGPTALDVIARWPGDSAAIDLVIMDVVMPAMSGPELADRIAAVLPDVPVLYMSGYADSPLLRGRLAEEDVPLINKPFTGRELTTRVRELLDSRTGPKRS
jgi:signal transduction histidine kinase/DNA-binding LacI/PurR family transcriptional regulator/CheY-like chemotaxis protein